MIKFTYNIFFFQNPEHFSQNNKNKKNIRMIHMCILFSDVSKSEIIKMKLCFWYEDMSKLEY